MDLTFWITIAVIVILLAVSAFFAGSETALTGASRARMHQLEQEGSRRARLVNRLRDKSERMIGALLFGNNLVNILSSALATSVLIGLFGDRGVVYATVGMTVLVVLFAEVMPKIYAINYPDRTALSVAPAVSALVSVLGPLVIGMGHVTRISLKSIGIEIHSTGITSNEEELRGAIELHRDEAKAEEIKEERAMLRSILDLAEVEVCEIMTHRRTLVMIDAALPAAQVVDEVLSSPFTRLPLWLDQPDNIVGVVHAKALLREVRAHHGDLDRIDILGIAAKPWFIPETTNLFDQLQAFRQRREHFALVVDEYGTLMGVVTLEDILEEIVGDISDEHDVTVAGVQVEPCGSYIVDGWVTIRDLNREFEWRLPDDEASTIAGLVLYEARRIPEVGQVFTFYDFRFEIIGRQRNQITSLRLTPPVDIDAPAGTGDLGTPV
ncbi:MAG: DUF21 domain-containing protein [Azospirillum sp.]|nr:DUF21 domain-containing protein [Azospirillum sp.]